MPPNMEVPSIMSVFSGFSLMSDEGLLSSTPPKMEVVLTTTFQSVGRIIFAPPKIWVMSSVTVPVKSGLGQV